VTRALVDSGHEVYVVEPLGTGSSSHPVDGDYSLDAQADRVSAALDSLGVGRAILVGSNFGASVAMRLAYQHPEHVAAVLSLDGGPIDRSYTAGVSVAMKLGPLLRLFGDDRVVTFVTYPHFVWLPAVMVMSALAGHLLIFRRLLSPRAHARPVT